MNAFNHTNAGGNIVNGGIGGVQTTSLMRKHGGGGSAGAGLTTFRGGIGSMKVRQKAFFNYLFLIFTLTIIELLSNIKWFSDFYNRNSVLISIF